MFTKKIKLILVFLLVSYQSEVNSQSISLNKFDTKNFSRYFSGIIAFENQQNSDALKFFDSTKILLNDHHPYLKKYVSSLVLENKISKAINLIKNNKNKQNINFFDAYLLLFLDSITKNDFKNANIFLTKAFKFTDKDRINTAVLESLKQYIYVFKEKKILDSQKDYGNLSLISKTFQKCFLNDPETESYFLNLINKNDADYTRYTFFYLNYLVENNKIKEAKEIAKNIKLINSTLLLSQAKVWLIENDLGKFSKVFSCKNYNDILSEFLFLISNLYASYDNLEKSNFYLNLSSFLNSKFIFNLSLVAENYYLKEDYEKTKKILKNFKKEHKLYYWYRVKTETQIIAKKINQKESLNYIVAKFNEIDEPDDRMIFDLANFYKSSKKYELAIKFYTKVLEKLHDSSDLKSDILYRRGGSYERMGDYKKADKDLLASLKINPDDPYVLNYLAYSWLERDYKINEAIKMLEKAYSIENNDPYIIDSIGWAYFLVKDYSKAEKFLRRALELMPNDPIVNDHYGDILWQLNRKIQARYFWNNVLEMDDAETDMIENINSKIIEGLKRS